MMRSEIPRDKQMIAAGKNTAERDYWLNKLSGRLIKSNFPFDNRGGEGEVGGGKPVFAAVQFRLDHPLFLKLMEITGRSDHKIHILLTGAMVVMLAQTAGNKDIILCTPIYKPDIGGDFINTLLPLRVRTRENMTFKELLKQVGRTVIEAAENQNYPLEILFEQINQPLTGPGALLDTALVLENIQHKEHLHPMTANVIFSFARTGDSMEGIVEYNCHLYEPGTIERIIKAFKILLREVIFGLDVNISSLTLPPLSPDKNKSTGLRETKNPRPPQAKTGHEDPVEKKLLQIWADILEIEEDTIGIDDYFFQLKGNSLKAIMLTSRIHKEFDISIPLEAIFELRTIRKLSRYIKGAAENKYAAIEPAEKKEYYRLSSAQKRLYLLQQMDLQSTAYNVPILQVLEAGLDRERFKEKLTRLIRRHESLGTSFVKIGNEPFQVIHTPGAAACELEIEYCKVGREGAEAFVKGFVKPFDLAKAPLMRAALLEVEIKAENTAQHILMLDTHHIITDASSRAIFIKEFMELYNDGDLTPLKLQYRDYSEWQNSGEEKSAIKLQETYWLNQFGGKIPKLNMPGDYPGSRTLSFKGSSSYVEIDRQLTAGIKNAASQADVTLNIFLLAAYYVLLAKYTGREDIVVGNIITGRPHVDLENIIGFFVNMLAVRTRPGENKTFREFLEEVKQAAVKAYENQDYPFEELVDKLGIQREPGRHPLIDTVFTLRDPDLPEEEAPAVKPADTVLKAYDFENKTAHFDLLVYVIPRGGVIGITVEYSSNLFKKSTVERMSGHYIRLLQEVAADLNTGIYHISLMSREERNRILYDFNDTKIEYPKDKTIHELFGEQAVKGPDSTAVVGQSRALTYKELNKEAHRLAGLLIEKGITPGSIAGIMGRRSLEMMVGILGILKAGAAYLPIDADYPEERVKYMLADSGAEILIATGEFPSPLTLHPSPLTLHPPPLTPLAYIMYTSGSTGRPKGVMVEHRSVIRLVINNNFVELGPNTRILQTGAPVFDAVTFEIWGSLLNGGELHLVDNGVILDAGKLGGALKDRQINTLWLSSPLFNQLMEQDSDGGIFSPLQFLLVGGDVLSPKNINKVRHENKDLKVVNGYGPTENTTFSTCYTIERDFESSIPIGGPISNSTAYIVDKHNRLQPIGIAGELWVGGDGVSRGYLNNPELTIERFCLRRPGGLISRKRGEIPPWTPRKSFLLMSYMSYMSYLSYYKTGDLARWLPEGIIEFLGRVDYQVKIRGYRVELGEIGNCLSKHKEIKEAVVTVLEEGQDKSLCAYFTAKREFPAIELREYVGGELPGYMVPAYFIQLEKMPLNPNGKVDRGALPPPRLKAGQGYTAPTNETEEKLAAIWAEVLGIQKDAVGIHDDFFQLGGHSLKASLLASQAAKEFNAAFSLTHVFTGPTVKEMAAVIRRSQTGIYEEIRPVEKREYYPQSSAQKRLFFLEQFENIGTSYNIPAVLTMEGKLDKERFERAIDALVQRHETLRTSFELVNNEPVQEVHDKVEFEIEYYGSAAGEGKGTGEDTIIKRFIRPFALSKAPLFRVGIAAVGNHRYLLLYDIHHVVGDGTSMGILVDDFVTFYDDRELVPLKVQYKDFSAWQNHLIEIGGMEKQEEYWLNIFKGDIPTLNFPTDYPRPESLTFAGNRHPFRLELEDARAVRALALEKGVTLFMLLSAVFYVLLYRYAGQEDIVVGTGIMGRPHADLHRSIGMFVNSLALRNRPGGEKTFLEFLEEVKKTCIRAFANQDAQFDELVDKLNLERAPSRNPLFDVLLVVQNFERANRDNFQGSTLNDVTFSPYPYENKTSKFDLNISVWEREDEIAFNLEYAAALFKPTTIREIAGNFTGILKQVINKTDIQLKEVTISNELVEAVSTIPHADRSEFTF